MLNSTTANQLAGPPHFVDLHVNPGESVSIQFFDGNETILRGPTTIKMISQHAYPPLPMPVQVPPGHMIQQIVDENGTLRHIILSALNGNGNSFSTSPSFASQPHQTAPNSPYCCCCYNTCSSGANSQQNSMSSSLTTQPMQPHLNHTPTFPLNSSYARNRRSNRSYSSPNNKRPSNYSTTNYYNPNSSNKVNSSRYKTDNLKSNHFNRHSTTVHYDTPRPYDSSNDTKYYLNKNYDYSCNSSNASQTSTLDQISDNLKYYKDENFCIENDFSKKLFDANDVTSSKESNSCYLNCNHQPNIASDQESQKSSQSECLDQDNSSSSANFDVNYNKLVRSDFVDLSNESTNLTSELSDNHFVDSLFTTISQIEKEAHQVIETDEKRSDSMSNEKMDLTLEEEPPVAEPNLQEQSVEIQSDDVLGHDIEVLDNSERCDKSDSVESTFSKVDKKPLLNGGFDPYSVTGAPVHVICPDDINESEKSDSDQYLEEQSGAQSQPILLTPQRSPRHLLPKLEMINLAYNSLSCNSVRLKWFLTQASDQPESKRHFIVDLLQGSLDDSPNSRIVFQGHTNTYRVSHLQPQKEYTFRVRTNTEDAVLISNLLTITTTEQQNSVGSKACGRKSKQQLQQQLVQQQQQIYQQQQLLLQQQQLVEVRQVKSIQREALLENILSSDQRYAIIILMGFTFLALIVAVLIQQLLSVN